MWPKTHKQKNSTAVQSEYIHNLVLVIFSKTRKPWAACLSYHGSCCLSSAILRQLNNIYLLISC